MEGESPNRQGSPSRCFFFQADERPGIVWTLSTADKPNSSQSCQKKQPVDLSWAEGVMLDLKNININAWMQHIFRTTVKLCSLNFNIKTRHLTKSFTVRIKSKCFFYVYNTQRLLSNLCNRIAIVFSLYGANTKSHCCIFSYCFTKCIPQQCPGGPWLKHATIVKYSKTKHCMLDIEERKKYQRSESLERSWESLN